MGQQNHVQPDQDNSESILHKFVGLFGGQMMHVTQLAVITDKVSEPDPQPHDVHQRLIPIDPDKLHGAEQVDEEGLRAALPGWQDLQLVLGL
jgi:hypothetical protein